MIALGLAALGVVLPLLPTTPFVLVAAACFSKSSPRFYDRLLTNRVFGSFINHWREARSIPMRAKLFAVMSIAVIGGGSVVLLVEPVWAQIVIAAIMATVAIWIVTRPTALSVSQG